VPLLGGRPGVRLDWLVEPESERPPEAAPVNQQPATAPERGGRSWWPWIAAVLIGAAVLGVAVGLSLELRGRSLESSAPADAQSRPTFVIAPSVSPIPSRSPSPVVTQSPGGGSTNAGSTYVVQAGDSLRSIALNVYGDANAWPRIYDANRDVIGPDPDALEAGTSLTLP
jgi:nucleoid-associated protein YgaU